MAKQKNHKKHTKKGYNGTDLQQSSAPNSPTRNLPRRRRNMNQLSADDYKLRQEIERGGKLTIVDMESDGNCLFRSISDQLYYDYGNNHHEIRHDICNYIEDHKDDFIFFLVLDDKDAAENDEDAADFESYVANMRHDGDWGGQIELLAASRVFRRNITIYSSRLGKVTIEHNNPKGSSGPDLLLSYHDNEHYNSIRVSSVTKPSPPIKYYTSPFSRALPMDENEESQVTDNETVTEDKTSATTTATISPVSTPDVEMSETESAMGHDTSSKITSVEQTMHCDSLPPMETESLSVNRVHVHQNSNDRSSQSKSIAGETTNQILISAEMASSLANTDTLLMEMQCDYDENSNNMRKERCAEATKQNFDASDTLPACNKDGSTMKNQDPLNGPNDSTQYVETGNEQTILTENIVNDVATTDQFLVSDDSRPISANSDQPTIDGTFCVMQI